MRWTPEDPYWPSRVIPTALAVVALIIIAYLLFGAAAADAKGIRGHCGLHIGALVRRDSGGSVYQLRIGPRMYHSGGDMRCRGYTATPGATGAVGTSWQPFSLPSWRYFFLGRVTFQSALTAQGCKSFGAALAATLVTDGAASPGLVLGGAGCAYGVYQLGSLLPGTTSMTGMRLIK